MKNKQAINNQAGFSLVEVLVGIIALSIVAFAASGVLVNTTKDINKTQVIGVLKQNGQNVSTNLSDIIRSSSDVICVTNETTHTNSPTIPSTNLVVKNNGVYLRFRMMPPTATNNGYIVEDMPDTTGYQPANNVTYNNTDYSSSSDRICNADPVTANPLTDGIPANAAKSQVLTDQDVKNGVSVINVGANPGSFFQVTGSYQSDDSTNRPVVSINFVLDTAVQAPAGAENQVAPNGIPFQTSVQLR